MMFAGSGTRKESLIVKPTPEEVKTYALTYAIDPKTERIIKR
jgi:hypothetical protein